jgi:hypothetical protein
MPARMSAGLPSFRRYSSANECNSFLRKPTAIRPARSSATPCDKATRKHYWSPLVRHAPPTTIRAKLLPTFEGRINLTAPASVATGVEFADQNRFAAGIVVAFRCFAVPAGPFFNCTIWPSCLACAPDCVAANPDFLRDRPVGFLRSCGDGLVSARFPAGRYGAPQIHRAPFRRHDVEHVVITPLSHLMQALTH